MRFGGKTITVQDAAEFDWTQRSWHFLSQAKKLPLPGLKKRQLRLPGDRQQWIVCSRTRRTLVVPEVNPFVLTDYRNRNVSPYQTV